MSPVPQVTEAEFQKQVIQLARLYRWRLVHFRPARVRCHGMETYRTSYCGDDGFPDLVLARRGRVIFAELKTETGVLTAAQAVWIEELGPAAYVWRPRNWDDIEALLR